jgi:hypothetical protein
MAGIQVEYNGIKLGNADRRIVGRYSEGISGGSHFVEVTFVLTAADIEEHKEKLEELRRDFLIADKEFKLWTDEDEDPILTINIYDGQHTAVDVEVLTRGGPTMTSTDYVFRMTSTFNPELNYNVNLPDGTEGRGLGPAIAALNGLASYIEVSTETADNGLTSKEMSVSFIPRLVNNVYQSGKELYTTAKPALLAVLGTGTGGQRDPTTGMMLMSEVMDDSDAAGQTVTVRLIARQVLTAFAGSYTNNTWSRQLSFSVTEPELWGVGGGTTPVYIDVVCNVSIGVGIFPWSVFEAGFAAEILSIIEAQTGESGGFLLSEARDVDRDNNTITYTARYQFRNSEVISYSELSATTRSWTFSTIRRSDGTKAVQAPPGLPDLIITKTIKQLGTRSTALFPTVQSVDGYLLVQREEPDNIEGAYRHVSGKMVYTVTGARTWEGVPVVKGNAQPTTPARPITGSSKGLPK